MNGKLVAGVAVGIGVVAGAGVLLAACGNRGNGGTRVPQDGPMSELTKQLMVTLKPGESQRLSVTADARRQVGNGAFDGARLLQAADTHAYGTPTISTPATDVQNDGFATFNEIRHVVRHFDADASGAFDLAEVRAFEAAAGVRWIPA